MRNHVEYCDLLGVHRLVSPTLSGAGARRTNWEKVISLSDVVEAVRDFGNYRTCNPTFEYELSQGQAILQEHFANRKASKRPLNCLLLGPPGSGKTFLAKKLGGTLADSIFMEFNLSQADSPGRLLEIYHEIEQVGRRFNSPKIVFMDEFDVTTGGTSMIRFLIHLMYEGRFGEGEALKQTAFIFSGSYLRNRQLLSILQQNGSGFDFLRFLHDTYVHLSDRPAERREVRDFFDLSLRYREAKNQMSPDRDALDYLRRLDKLVDFLSRINGFVIEIPDLSAPLEVTAPAFWVSHLECGPIRCSELQIKSSRGREIANDVWKFVRAWERRMKTEARSASGRPFPKGLHLFKNFTDSPLKPILLFKNMLLCERLARVVMMIGEKFADDVSEDIQISRPLLNYLSVVPVVHGMRSLEYVIGKLSLDPDGDQQKRLKLDPTHLNEDITRMHLLREGHYRDDASAWATMRARNPRAFDPSRNHILQEDLITLTIKTKREA